MTTIERPIPPPLRLLEPVTDPPRRPSLPANLAAELERVGVATALDALRLSPWLIAATLRRELGGRTWDVTISCTYWRATNPDGTVVQESRYHWGASEPVFTLDEGELPDEIVCSLVFATPEAALADAEKDLLERCMDGGTDR